MTDSVLATTDAAALHDAEGPMASQAASASEQRPLRLVTASPSGAETIEFAAPPMVAAEDFEWRTFSISSAGSPLVTIVRQPSEEELLVAGRNFINEFEQEFGPISEDIIAEVRRKWHA